jgi:hypothetical protein
MTLSCFHAAGCSSGAARYDGHALAGHSVGCARERHRGADRGGAGTLKELARAQELWNEFASRLRQAGKEIEF